MPWKCIAGRPDLWRHVRKGVLKKINSRSILKFEEKLDKKKRRKYFSHRVCSVNPKVRKDYGCLEELK